MNFKLIHHESKRAPKRKKPIWKNTDNRFYGTLAEPASPPVEQVDFNTPKEPKEPIKNTPGFHSVILWSARLPILVGLLVLMGWLLNIPMLTTGLFGLPTMKFNTALCFIMLGTSLWLHFQGGLGKAKLARGLAAMVALISLLTLYEYFSGQSIGIDSLLFHTPESDLYLTPSPGRMSFLTGTGLVFLAWALILANVPWKRLFRIAQGLTLISALLGIMTCIGYLYGDQALFTVENAAMALITAILMIVLTVGIFALQPDWLFIRVFTSATPGGFILRRLLPTATLLTLAAGWLILQGVNHLHFGATTELVLLTLLFLVTSTPLIYGVAYSLHQADMQKQQYSSTLEANENRLHLLTDAMPVLISYLNTNLVYEFANQSYEDWFGIPVKNIIGKPIEAVLGKEAVASLRPYLDEVLSGKTVHFETLAPYQMAGTHYIKASYIPHFDSNGVQRGFYALVEDISEQKAAETALRENERLLRLFVENTPIPVAMFDRKMRYMMANPAWSKAFNLMQTADLIGKSHYTIFPNMPEHWKKVHQEALAGNIRSCEEEIYTLPSGDQETLRWAVYPWYQGDNEVGGIIIYSEMITLRKKAERELADIRHAIEASTIVSVTDVKGIITYVNDAFCTVSQFSRDELIGQTHRLVNSGYHPKAFFQDMWSTIGQGRVWKGEVKNKAKDGSTYWMDTTIYPYMGSDGKPYQFIALRHDITALKALEASLKSNVYQQKIISLLGHKALSGLSVDNLMDLALQLLVQLLEVEYSAVFQMIPDTDSLRLKAGYNWQKGYVGTTTDYADLSSQSGFTVLMNEPVVVENMAEERRFIRAPMLEAHHVQSGVSVVIYEKDQKSYGVLSVHSTRTRHYTIQEVNFLQAVANILGIAIDRKEAENEIIRFSQELEQRVQDRTRELEMARLEAVLLQQKAEEANQAKSKILAFVSHDFKNPLNSIIGYSGLLERGCDDQFTEKQRKFIHNISLSGKHLLNMVTQILDVARAEAGQLRIAPETFELQPVLHEIEELISSQASAKNVSLHFEAEPGLDHIEADPKYFRQILLNLLSNGIKYNHKDGWVKVVLQRTPDEKQLVCTVQDSGIGIPEDKQADLFTEFFRAGREGPAMEEGTGLGLAFIKKLVELHGGTICVNSTEGSGSTFTFTLSLDPESVGP